MRRLAALVLLLPLAACGGGGKTFSSAAAVAEAAGCSDVVEVSDDELQMLVSESVECSLDGRELQVHWFKSDASFREYRDAPDVFGLDNLAYGDGWAVQCDDGQEDCKAFKDAIG